MPVEEVAYAACNSPTQNAQPAGQFDKGSKSPKTYSAVCLPFLAKASVQVTMTASPANVQNIAKVCGKNISQRARIIDDISSTHINERQPTIPKRRDCIAKQSNANENEKYLICFRRENIISRRSTEHIHAADDE